MVYSTDLLMIGPTSHGDDPAFFLLKPNVISNLIIVIITFAFREIDRLSNSCGHCISMLKKL